MATATNYVPVEVYLRSDFEPDAEYVDGVIEERPMGEFDHACWQDAIQAWFRLHVKKWNTRALPELRVQVAPTRYRVPDVTVLDRDRPIERIVTRPPLAVFEILSPEDAMKRVLRKLGDYSAMGIEQIWVIDQDTRTYYQFTEGKLVPGTYFGAVGDRIHFAMNEVEAFLDE
jgi:Uma2 family endonuclease